MIGQTILNYTIDKLIGEGGMGKVYLATDSFLRRKFAIKVLDTSLIRNPLFIERFKQEANVLFDLNHPTIVRAFNFIVYDSNYFIVMEYVMGETLKTLINRTGPIAEYRALHIFNQIASGLSYAHEKGIIHRDIKPDNIIIDKHDNIKILDFGIAKIMYDTGLTRTGTKMGSVYYMSPEQIKAEKNIDHQTDIYSSGIVLYEMLTGKLPFNTETNSDFEIMKEIVEGEILDPRDYYPHISKKSVDIILYMTQKDKMFRMSSMPGIYYFKHDETLAILNNNQLDTGKTQITENQYNPVQKNNNKYYLGLLGLFYIGGFIATLNEIHTLVGMLNYSTAIIDYIHISILFHSMLTILELLILYHILMEKKLFLVFAFTFNMLCFIFYLGSYIYLSYHRVIVFSMPALLIMLVSLIISTFFLIKFFKLKSL